jgi:hypothetical protein
MPVKPINTSVHPLVGRCLHGKNEEGIVDYQAQIRAVFPSNAVVGDLVLIQYFDALVGEASTLRLLPLTELTHERWVLYEDLEHMNFQYEHVERYRTEMWERRQRRKAGENDP